MVRKLHIFLCLCSILSEEFLGASIPIGGRPKVEEGSYKFAFVYFVTPCQNLHILTHLLHFNSGHLSENSDFIFPFNSEF